MAKETIVVEINESEVYVAELQSDPKAFSGSAMSQSPAIRNVLGLLASAGRSGNWDDYEIVFGPVLSASAA